MENTKNVSSSSNRSWLTNVYELSMPVKIALTALGSGIVYLAVKSLQDRSFSRDYLESLPVLKIAAAVAGFATLALGGYLLGSRKTTGAEKKEELQGDDSSLGIPFESELPKFLLKSVKDSGVSYAVTSFDERPSIDVLQANPQSLIFFQFPGEHGIHLKLQMKGSASSPSDPQVISAIIHHKIGKDQTTWKLFLHEVKDYLHPIQQSTTWDPSVDTFSNEKPKESEDGFPMNLDQMLYAWLAGESCTITNGLEGEDALSRSLSLVKPASSLPQEDSEED